MKLKIKKGDTVVVIAGNNKGATGRVLMVYPTTMRVLIEGVNLRKKAVRPSQQNPNGGIITVELADKKGKPTRVSRERSVVNGKTVVKRTAKTTGEEL
jgi:large subunit ribosomal protein L24